MHGLVEIAPGDEKIPRDPFNGPVGHDEAESPRVDDDPADDDVHHVGKAEAVAPRFEDGAARHEVVQQALERRTLLAGYLEALLELARRRGMIDVLFDQLQQLLVIQHYWQFNRAALKGWPTQAPMGRYFPTTT